jgi:hypothetical protein
LEAAREALFTVCHAVLSESPEPKVDQCGRDHLVVCELLAEREHLAIVFLGSLVVACCERRVRKTRVGDGDPTALPDLPKEREGSCIGTARFFDLSELTCRIAERDQRISHA